ncbi:MAG: triose-phosphate isomerase [Flavobacteriaceae bacterium]
MRKNIVAGNWKMNLNHSAGAQLLEDLSSGSYPDSVRMIVGPSFVQLEQSQRILADTAIEVMAQNVHQAASGAFTGEVSVEMLDSIGIKTVILGHSERREQFGEDNTILAQKVAAALDAGLEIIFCFGELLAERKQNQQTEVVAHQLEVVLNRSQADWSKMVLAYEPVWAIGTGETASPEQAQEMHAFIRGLIREKLGDAVADQTSILYGGSVKPANAAEIFQQADVDGGLVGGASLKADDFLAIANAF